jgi:hypothetical protein
LPIHVTGTAEIYDRSSQTTVRVPASDVEWHAAGTIEMDDGTATVWEGKVTVGLLGELIWSILEKPDGRLGPIEHDLNPESVIRDFEISVV